MAQVVTTGLGIIALGVAGFLFALAWAEFDPNNHGVTYDPPILQAIIGVGGMFTVFAGIVVMLVGAFNGW